MKVFLLTLLLLMLSNMVNAFSFPKPPMPPLPDFNLPWGGGAWGDGVERQQANYDRFDCTEEQTPAAAIWGRYIPYNLTNNNEMEFIFFERTDDGPYLNLLQWIDLTRRSSLCPYRTANRFNVTSVEADTYWSQILLGNSRFNTYSHWWLKTIITQEKGLQEVLNALYIDIQNWTPWNLIKEINYYTNPNWKNISPKRDWIVLKEVDGKIFAFWWDMNKDIWRFYWKSDLGNSFWHDWWQKVIASISWIPNWSSIIDAFGEGSSVALLLLKNYELSLFLLTYSSNTFTPNSGVPETITGLNYNPTSIHKIKCDSSSCKIAVLNWETLKIKNLNNFNETPIEIDIWRTINSWELFLSNDRVIVKEWNSYYSVEQRNNATALEFKFFEPFYAGWWPVWLTLPRNPLFPDTESAPAVACNITDNSDDDIWYLDIHTWSPSDTKPLENQVFTYADQTSYCYKNRYFSIQTRNNDCWTCVKYPMKQCFPNPKPWKSDLCWHPRVYMKTKMPFRFIYYYNAIVKPQPIFTFTKNNELNFSGNFDFWNKRIIWIFGREEDDNFKWFNSKNIKDMLTVEKNVDLVRKGLEIKFKKTPSFAIWNDFYADKTWLVYSETWMINYRESEIFKWSYNFLKEFPPGHHKLHLVFFARNNDYDADLTFRANMVYWFWDWWRWAYWTLQGVSDEELNLDSRAFWLSPDIKPDNYNIYYYVVVYDFYVPEISNISWTDKLDFWKIRDFGVFLRGFLWVNPDYSGENKG